MGFGSDRGPSKANSGQTALRNPLGQRPPRSQLSPTVWEQHRRQLCHARKGHHQAGLSTSASGHQCSSQLHAIRRRQLSIMLSMSYLLHTCAGAWLVPALLFPTQLVLCLDQQLAGGLCDVPCGLAPLAGRGGCGVCGWYRSVTLQQQAGSVRCGGHGILQDTVQAASHR